MKGMLILLSSGPPPTKFGKMNTKISFKDVGKEQHNNNEHKTFYNEFKLLINWIQFDKLLKVLNGKVKVWYKLKAKRTNYAVDHEVY